jgi:hypothetical protein
VWRRDVDGQVLTFHLAGINNQNFLMRDEETGSFWQQISGKCVAGPMAGRELKLVYSDEVTAALWREENPNGMILSPLSKYKSEYEKKDWDKKMAKVRTVLDFPKTGIASRELMFGIAWNGASKAFPVKRLLDEKVVVDRVGGEPVLIVVGPDGKSIRAFHRKIPNAEAAPDFYRAVDVRDVKAEDANAVAEAAKKPLLMDAATGSEWNFKGCAVSGKAQGTCLEPIPALKDYWFDWRNYHPNTTVYNR